MKLTIALVCSLLLMNRSFSQALINTTGTTVANNNYIFEYSLGELGITTISSSDNFITQGVLQPYVKLLNKNCNIINLPLQTFPNPTRDKFRIVGQYNWIQSYEIFSSSGQLVRFETFSNNYIDLSGLPNALYFIKLHPSCDDRNQTLKVIKQ